LRFPEFSEEWIECTYGEQLKYEQPTKYIVKNTDYLDSGIPVLTANKAFILGYINETKVYNKGECFIFDDFTMDTIRDYNLTVYNSVQNVFYFMIIKTQKKAYGTSLS